MTDIKNKPDWLHQKAREVTALPISHTPSLGADVVELHLYPALLADPFKVEHYPFPEFRMQHPLVERDAAGVGDRAPLVLAKVTIQDATKPKVGTVLIPLQSAEGQRQRQGRHQG